MRTKTPVKLHIASPRLNELNILVCVLADPKTTQAEIARRQHLILTGATDGLWDWNLQTGEDFHSTRYQEPLGYGPGELPDTAAGFEAIVHPDDLPHVKAAQQAHLAER